MTTIRQLIQTSPAKANELFARLVDTSDTAVKTREKLFSDLKEELELLAKLEEEHLFPVLRKHKETKELVAEAIDDNKQMRKILLTELETTPRDGEEFAHQGGRAAQLFQQHVRDEKNELLPAVLKVVERRGGAGHRREDRGPRRPRSRKQSGRRPNSAGPRRDTSGSRKIMLSPSSRRPPSASKSAARPSGRPWKL